MVKGIKFRRGTTADHSTFTGQEGEITVDTTKDVAIVHDGITVGGYPLVGENSTQRITNKDINATALNVSGVVTATSFRGDGSQLTGISAGGETNYWNQTSAGIHTLSNVGIGTTNPRFALEVGAVGASGTSLLVNGDARITGILTVGTASITIDGDTNTITVPNLVVTNSTTGVTASGVGITVRDGGGDLGSASIIDFGNNLTVSFASGIATITGAAGGGGSSQWVSTAVGIHTLSNVGVGTTNPTSALTVKGNTSLETLSVSGVSTFVGNAVFQGNINLGDNDTLYFGGNNALSISSPGTVGGGGVISGGVNLYDWLIVSSASGGNTVAKFRPTIGDGSDNVELYYGGSKKFQTIGAGVTVTGTTFTNQLSVSGVSTFADTVTINGSVQFNDNKQLNFGTNTNATLSYNTATSSLRIFANNTDTNLITDNFNVTSNSKNALKTYKDAQVELYYNNTKKFETLGAGVTVTGTTFTNQLSVSGVSTFGTSSGIRTEALKVYGYGDINGLTIKGNSSGYIDNVIITQHPATSFEGGRNVAIGDYSFTTPGAAGESVAIGYYALNVVGNNDTGNNWSGNVGVGAWAGQSITTTLRSTFIGYGAGRYVTTGSENTILGAYDGNSKGLDIRTSSNNVVLSDGAGNIRFYANSSGNVGIGTTNPTSKLTVTGNALITGATTITGNLNAPGNYYVKLARTTNQTVLTDGDTLIGFTATSDANGWYSGITTRTTPNVEGTYYVSAMLNWQAGASSFVNQSNIQIRKNGSTFALSIAGIQTHTYTLNACGIVTMNGTTDYIDFTAYTSNPTSQVVTGTADGSWTKMEIFKIN